MTTRAQILARLQRSLGEAARAIADLIAAELDSDASLPRRRPLSEAAPAQVVELLSVTRATLEHVRRQAVQPPVPRTRDGDRIVSKREAARIIGVSHSTLWRMEKEKVLVPVAMRGGGRYRESQLTAYMNSLPSHEVDRSRIAAALASPKHGPRKRPPQPQRAEERPDTPFGRPS